MENFLLWLLRTLLLLVITAAFAVPVIRTSQFGELLGKAHRDVALVLDVSYSMDYETGQRRVWDDARNAALAVLRGLQEGDRAAVLLAADQPEALIEKPSADLTLVANLIGALEPRPGSSRLPDALVPALNALKESTSREREVFVFTDGQALPWNGFSATNRPGAPIVWDPRRVDRNIAFFALLAGPRTPENGWPFDVALAPSILTSNTAATLTTRIAHTGPATDMTVTLHIDDMEIGRRQATLDANGLQDVAFPLPPLSPGIHTARFSAPADGLALDDTFHALLRVHEQLPTLCVGSAQDALFLMTALDPGQGREAPGRVDPGELDAASLRAYSSIFLVNALPLPGQTMLALETYVRAGGTLAIFPGDNADPAAYRDWSVLPAKPDAVVEPPEGRRVRPLRLVLTQDPIFADFALPPGATPTLAIRRHLHWPKLEEDSAEVVAAGNDSSFLVSRTAGKGRVLLCSVSADRRWSSLPMTSFFLPLVQQIVQFGAGLSRDPLYFWAAPTLPISDILPDFRDGDQIVMPNGRPLTVRSVRQDAEVKWEAENADEPGIYLLSRGGEARAPTLAVNVPRAESDLTPVNPDSLPALTGLHNLRVTRDADELQRQIGEHRRGRPLTEACFWLALALAIAEWWLANRISRHRTATAAVHVQASGRINLEPQSSAK
jgi:hypothetical protein